MLIYADRKSDINHSASSDSFSFLHYLMTRTISHSRAQNSFSFSPVVALDPVAEVLADGHGEVVIVKLVHLFQELGVQLLQLEPLTHLGGLPHWKQSGGRKKTNYVASLVNNVLKLTSTVNDIDIAL